MATAIWAAILASFLASAVEYVEAFTIVLAVGIVNGWRSAFTGAIAATIALAVVIAGLGAALTQVPLNVIQAIIGVLLLLFGLKWIRKAMLRYSGFKSLHDEGQIFEKEVAELRQHKQEARQGLDWFGVSTSFSGVFLEGMEVAFIVLGFGLGNGASQQLVPAALGALGAAVVVIVVGVALRAPLQRIPENTMKYVVGIMLTSFGTFWAGEGLKVSWWHGDLSLPFVIAGFVVISLLGILWLKRIEAGRHASMAPASQAEPSAGGVR